MDFQHDDGSGISRKEFLKKAAVGAAGVAAATMIPAALGAEEKGKPDAVTSASTMGNSGSGAAEALSADWLGAPPLIADGEISRTVTSDVVVVGGGHGGLQAAWAAAKGGATVSVIEAQTEDKYTWIGEQIGHFNSQFHIGQGFGPYDEGPFGMTPFLILNCKGERFMNEDVAIGQQPVINRQPLGTIATVFDRNWQKICERNSVNHGNPDYGVPAFIAQATEDMARVAGAGKAGSPVRSMAITERMGGTVYGTDSLSALADILGYEGKKKETFLASIDRYNELCQSGVDEDFGKARDVMIPVAEAPFYGYKSDNKRASVGLVTLTGLVTDNDFNVLDDEGHGIPGLYAVGNCLGGRYAVAYATPVAGNSIGMAMTHGMLAGELAARL